MAITIVTVGRITKDLEAQKSRNGTIYLNFALAVNKGYGENAHVIYLQCWAFKDLAESLLTAKAKKGSLLQITGDMDVVEYQRKDGTKEFAPKIILTSWEFSISNNKEKAEPHQPAAPASICPAEMTTILEADEIQCVQGELPL